ncbi:GntR family transcriptional regulator [Mesobaculum littorinae]|uniref:GntR family transcriptional regulator n=1 Tax=Mesobaculum littorinae TaxID=2486419 RepID=A0A438AHU0_9RHOB|nr:GntR family transcriptional regulator [Mesobaculum littorinae]RVV98293.1 GntR family transcriptional regulator [Mesobaculum littorinae]
MRQDQIDQTAPIARQLTRFLRERIIRNDLHPDQKISESEIAQQYDVSRQPVREAFIRLASEGLVSVLPQRGTRVSRIDVVAVREARFLREAVESDIVRLLAEAPGRADLAELDAHIDRQRAVAAGDPLEFIRADEAFHRTLAEMGGKAGIWRKVQGLKAQMDRVRVLSLSQFPVNKLIDQHAAIVAGIAAGDPARAEAATRHHLREVLSDLPQIVTANPAFFDDAPDGDEDRTVIIGGGE